MKQKIDIAQVAKAAGVSTTTVSRVINRVATVSEDNQRRVRETIKRLGYRPNLNAQRLASGKANLTIAFVIPRFEGIFHSYYALQVLKGSGIAAERLRCDLLVHITDGKTFVNPMAVNGVIFADLLGCEELLDRTLDEGIPTVVLNHYLEELPVNCVAIDNRTAAERVVDYLVRLGHRDIATITGDLKVQAGLDRLDGFVKAMKSRQLPVREAHIRFGDFGLPSARAAAEALLALKERPTAIFVASDDMALETINVALAKGLRVPEELSVVGFDDNPIAEHARVPLTTVRQPLTEMGRLGLDILFQHLKGKKQSPTKLLLPTELVERVSCRQTWLEPQHHG
ncbi:MAG: LacI family DNA-binding transcriptional regulator [Candidatus Omnitrophica bacterium]|nr:LacI family DNA-binding transcriptional regulator [Candidatus Omnitrophota bacterium]